MSKKCVFWNIPIKTFSKTNICILYYFHRNIIILKKPNIFKIYKNISLKNSCVLIFFIGVKKHPCNLPNWWIFEQKYYQIPMPPRAVTGLSGGY